MSGSDSVAIAIEGVTWFGLVGHWSVVTWVDCDKASWRRIFWISLWDSINNQASGGQIWTWSKRLNRMWRLRLKLYRKYIYSLLLTLINCYGLPFRSYTLSIFFSPVLSSITIMYGFREMGFNGWQDGTAPWNDCKFGEGCSGCS